VQVDPIKPKLKPPGIERLKLSYDEPPSNFAYKFSFRHYNVPESGSITLDGFGLGAGAYTRSR
jgi:hypothetical protein